VTIIGHLQENETCPMWPVFFLMYLVLIAHKALTVLAMHLNENADAKQRILFLQTSILLILILWLFPKTNAYAGIFRNR
jgi:hypothetical protein